MDGTPQVNSGLYGFWGECKAVSITVVLCSLCNFAGDGGMVKIMAYALGKIVLCSQFYMISSYTGLKITSPMMVLYKRKVKVNTVLGSSAPPLTVKLVRASISGTKDSSVIESLELKFDPETAVHFLDVLPKSVDVGNYKFVFEIVLHDSEDKNVYATGGQTQVPVFVTGLIKIDNAEIAVLDSDHGSVETQKKLDLAGENAVSLSANHLQKLRLSFRLATPRGNIFKPHQAFLKLRHETKVEHIFVVGNSGKQFEIILDFLGLVEKFFYLSGRYDIELTVGDAVMENSFLRAVGHVELDLPEAPEKAPRPPPLAVDPSSRYGPKAEITHIFRSPEKRPPQELSLAFLGLTLLPLVGFLIGDFLGLVEKFFYLSGRYDIELTVGDAVMENSFLRAVGHVELDLPEAPEKAPRPPPLAVDPSSRYGPKAEITHIFRSPEKRPPQELSLAFLGLTLLPLVGFLIGLLRIGVNLKNFPTSAVPATFALLFHLGIAAVLLLYVLFWLKLDLFITLKTLCFLGTFLMFVGHRILSHLASTSAKLKSA
nr:dolichyl-diphosphooligosaccharide--protein glycosyltransferase subunit 2 [Quercus suber]